MTMNKILCAAGLCLLILFLTAAGVLAEKEVLMTFAGDCTLGGEGFNRKKEDSFFAYVEKYGYDYFFANFRNLFENDDLTVVNLEGVLTDSEFLENKKKTFRFRGDTDYVKILTGSSVEAVTTANNHITDFGEQGDRNTRKTLDENGVGWFRADKYYTFERDGIRIVFFGLENSRYYSMRTKLAKQWKEMKESGEASAIVVYVHTGIEYVGEHEDYATKMATNLIDMGADLVGFADVSGLAPDGYQKAVVAAIALPPEIVYEIPVGPTPEYIQTYKEYNRRLEEMSRAAAAFLNEQGHRSLALCGENAPWSRETMASPFPYKTSATRAGLGWVGKCALLVTPEYGSAIRLTVALTDIEIANSLGFKVAITTNGTLLSRVGDGLIRSGVYKVNISLHSLEGEDNAAYLESVADFADRASAAGVLTVLRLWNGGEENRENDGVLEFLHKRLSGEWQFGARGARIRHRLHLEYGERFEWPDITLNEISERVFCYGLSDHFGILSDGTVIPCCLDSDGIINLGNIFHEDINEILFSKRAVDLRQGFQCGKATEDLCKRCGYAQRFVR